MMNETASPMGFEIDIGRLRSLFDEALTQLRRDLVGPWNGEREDIRASALAWATRFVPEGLSPRFRVDLERLVGELRVRSRFRVDFWDRCLPLDVALFSLTNDRKWLEVALCNVDHHNSGLRLWVLECLALVADLVDFEASELLARTERNVEINQMFCDWNVVLLAAAHGSADRKRELFNSWRAKFAESPLFSVGSLLDDLSRGSSVNNPFLSYFLRIHQYILLRLAATVTEPAQLSLPITDDFAPERTGRPPHGLAKWQLGLGGDILTGDLVWRRLREHPLMESHFALKLPGEPR